MSRFFSGAASTLPTRRALAPRAPSLADFARLQGRDARREAERAAALERACASVPTFDEMLRMRLRPVAGAAAEGAAEPLPLRRRATRTVQVNIGKLCNLACAHCHVESSPARTAENMGAATAARVLELLARSPGVGTLDLTGGAPELNPHFRTLVEGARALGLDVIDRCNLSVLLLPGQETTAAFLAAQSVRIIASLPDTAAASVDAQRGAGSHGASVEALRRLNALGYGRSDAPHLRLDLIANPVGLALPVPEAALEARFRAELASLPGGAPVVFSRLLTLTNMPIKRFADDLARKGQLAQYVSLLAMNLNPATLPLLMCRSTASVDWRGVLYDCDFNQALSLPLLADGDAESGGGGGGAPQGGGAPGAGASSAGRYADGAAGAETGPPAARRPLTIFDVESFSDAALEGRPVRTHKACFGCTAGAGSSCGGALL
jgi:radical SAM/Cys-rich protein